MRRKMKSLLVLVGICFLYLPSLNAEEDYKLKNNGVISINIDNPSFRPLAMSIPHFGVADKSLEAVAKDAHKQLAELLKFSGYFKLLNQDITNQVLTRTSLKEITDESSATVTTMRKLGGEAITYAYIERDEKNFLQLSIKTVDLVTGKRLVGKRYRRINDISRDLRSYADRVLEAYTGKPGIFTSRILFTGKKTKTSNRQIYMCDFDGSNLVQLTTDDTIHDSPSWGPDGKSILYTSFKYGNADIFQMDIATRKSTRLSSGQTTESGATYTPDGKLVVFTSAKDGDSDLFYKVPGSNTKKRLIRGQGLDVEPAVSPDGRTMLYVSGRYGNPHIFSATLSWNKVKNTLAVTGDKRLTFAGWYNATPAWSGDNRKILFAGFDKEINRFDVFMMDPDGGKLERLTISSGDNEYPSWAPNDQLIVFQSNRIGKTNQKGVYQLYMMNRDGSNQRKINTGLYEASVPRWSPVPNLR